MRPRCLLLAVPLLLVGLACSDDPTTRPPDPEPLPESPRYKLEPARLARTWTLNEQGPTWSPSGERILFATRGSDGGSVFWLMDRAGTELTRLMRTVATWDRDPAWSPDGRSIAFLREDRTALQTGSGLFVRNLVDGSERLLVPAVYLPSTWSPNGLELAFGSWRGVYVVGVHGGEPRLLAGSDGFYLGILDWSPDGTRIACAARGSGLEAEIWLLPSGGGDATQLTNLSPAEAPHRILSLRWSPDGTWLAYVYSEIETTGSHYELRVRNLATGVETLILQSDNRIESIDWPAFDEGAWITFTHLGDIWTAPSPLNPYLLAEPATP